MNFNVLLGTENVMVMSKLLYFKTPKLLQKYNI